MSDRRIQIIRAALAVFARYGLKRASMADVAQEAGLSRPALYQYFRGKDDLIAACFDQVADDGIALAEAEAARQHSPRDRVRAYLVTYMVFFYRLSCAGPHSEDVVELKTRFGPDKVARARRQLIARLDELAERPAADDTGALLAHAAEGLKLQAEDEAALARRLERLVDAVLG